MSDESLRTYLHMLEVNQGILVFDPQPNHPALKHPALLPMEKVWILGWNGGAGPCFLWVGVTSGGCLHLQLGVFLQQPFRTGRSDGRVRHVRQASLSQSPNSASTNPVVSSGLWKSLARGQGTRNMRYVDHRVSKSASVQTSDQVN